MVPTPTLTPLVAETGDSVFTLFWFVSVLAAGIVGAILRSIHPIRMFRSWRLTRKAKKLADDIETLLDDRATTTPQITGTKGSDEWQDSRGDRHMYLVETMRFYSDQGFPQRVSAYSEELDREGARVEFKPKKPTWPSDVRKLVLPDLRKISAMKRLVP